MCSTAIQSLAFFSGLQYRMNFSSVVPRENASAIKVVSVSINWHSSVVQHFLAYQLSDRLRRSPMEELMI